MAPLYSQIEDYSQACTCLKKVIEEETQEILKVGLYTKLAGNFKKANMKEQCVKASTDAFELIKRISGEKDAQTCRCMINLAQVYQTFEEPEDAKRLYQQYLEMYGQ